MTKTQIESVLLMFETASFERWYSHKFTDYIEGNEHAPSREEILEWLSSRLGLLDAA